jgi:hypothetical protein
LIPIPITITRSEFKQFVELQVKKRKGWRAVFSTNLSEELWPFVTLGLTPEELRNELRRRMPLLDRIVGIYIEHRQSGGRFFINDEGVFWKTDEGLKIFIKWNSNEDLHPVVKQRKLTISECLERSPH